MISRCIQTYGKLKTDRSNFVSMKHSEGTRHLDLDAKHNPMHDWLLPWGARRLRFNGDTEGMTLSVCILPSLHTTSRLVLFYLVFSPNKNADALSYTAMPTLKFGQIHTYVCVCTYLHNLTQLYKSSDKNSATARWSQLEFDLWIKTLVKIIFLLHEKWNWLKKWWICAQRVW